MTARPVTPAQIRAYVDKARQAGDAVVGFRAAPVWDDNGSLGGDVVVAPCPSTLAARAAVWDHLDADDGRLLVLLTDRDDVGQEILARLYRRQLLQPQSFEILKDLFRVTEIHPSLRDYQWLADLLVDVAPVGRTYAPPPGGVLDLDTAWRALLIHGLELPTDRPSLRDLVAWAATPRSSAALAPRADGQIDLIAQQLTAALGTAAGVVVRLVREGRSSGVVPLGLTAAVLFADLPSTDSIVAGRTRLEGELDGELLGTAAARSWGEAAEALVAEAERSPDQSAFAAWTSRAEALLTQSLKVPELLIESRVLPGAFTARIEAVAVAVSAALDGDEQAFGSLGTLLQRLREHIDAERLASRVRLAEMAVRLTRRHVAHASPELGRDLAEVAREYLDEWAWVDEASTVLLDGDQSPGMAAVAHRLVTLAAEDRRPVNERFAEHLARWTAADTSGTDGLMPIETVLDRVAVPAVRAGVPVLVLLLDGLSWAQAHRMFDDIAHRRFRRVAPDGRWAPVVSTLPSVTQVSRSSLFVGRPAAGGQDVEREGFAHHRGLLDASRGKAPVLFHKADLYAVDGHAAPEVRAALTDPDQPVVGVVVNAADDHLDKGAQLELAQGLRAIKPLDGLLQWAVEAGRAVVVVSDHGHVREAGSHVHPVTGGGERWAPADAGGVGVELAGRRVLASEGRIVAAVSDRVRFHPTKKLGYHGGASPQEVLCPLAVFLPGGVEVPGWLPALPEAPPWWSYEPVVAPDLPTPSPMAGPPTDDQGVPTLFGADRSVSSSASAGPRDTPPWVTALLESEVYAVQQRAAGRQTLDRADVAHLLVQLDRAGGTLTAEAFARATGTSSIRARTKATALAALLNVDGYRVLTVDGSGEVTLDRAVLDAQFGLRS